MGQLVTGNSVHRHCLAAPLVTGEWYQWLPPVTTCSEYYYKWVVADYQSVPKKTQSWVQDDSHTNIDSYESKVSTQTRKNKPQKNNIQPTAG